MLSKCTQCSKDFQSSVRKINDNKKRGLNIFCSVDCYKVYRNRNKVITNCAFCKKEIIKTLSNLKNSKTGNLYCSHSCAVSKNNSLFKTGENHPNYKNGGGSYRDQKLRLSDNICEDCGSTDIRVLEVHHIDKNRKNNKIDNLAILCANCHKIRHYEDGL